MSNKFISDITLMQAIDTSIYKWQKYVEHGGFARIEPEEIPIVELNIQVQIYNVAGCGLCFYQMVKNICGDPSKELYKDCMCCDCPIAEGAYGTKCTDKNSLYDRWLAEYQKAYRLSGSNIKGTQEMVDAAQEMLNYLLEIKKYYENKKNQQKD